MQKEASIIDKYYQTWILYAKRYLQTISLDYLDRRLVEHVLDP